MNTVNNDSLISVAAVLHNDADIVADFLHDIQSILSAEWEFFEVVLIDNGSTDNTLARVKELQSTVPSVRMIVLSKEYDKEIALSAAVEHCIGDYVVLMDPNHDPPALIPQLLQEIQTGIDVVVARRENRNDDGVFYRQFAPLFYSVISLLSGMKFSPYASEYRAMTRRAVNSAVEVKSKSPYMKYTNALVGFKQSYIPYTRTPRRPKKHHHSFFGSVGLAVDVIVSNSVIPLRLVSIIGFFAGLLNLLFILYVFIVSTIKDDIAEGWVSSSLVNAAMFFFLFTILTVLCEYIARILIESKDQPLYFVAEEHNSNIVSTFTDTINVV